MKKEKWEIALDKFMKDWKDSNEVVGAVVCGSYVTSDPSEHSDIDVQILLDTNIKWRERGNKIVDGFLIEYFANPLFKNLKYFEDEFEERSRVNVHMFTTGKVLFDKNGDVKTMIKKAKEWKKKKFPRTNKIVKEIHKYSIWDMLDNLEEVYESNGDEFYYVYYNHLSNLFEKYSAYLGFNSIDVHKLKRFLTDKKDQKKYEISSFPDRKFSDMIVRSISLNNKKSMMKNYKQLTNHVLKEMGGFNIDGWKIRSPVEK